MNCKPGDLAIIVSSAKAPNQVGKIVRVVRYEISISAWVISPALPEKSGRLWTSVSDHLLRPIRDPGEDAEDESRAWLPPVPLPTIEPTLLPKEKT